MARPDSSVVKKSTQSETALDVDGINDNLGSVAMLLVLLQSTFKELRFGELFCKKSFIIVSPFNAKISKVIINRLGDAL